MNRPAPLAAILLALVTTARADDTLKMKAAPEAPAATAATSAPAPAETTALPDGRELLKAYVAATGGTTALEGVQNALVKATYSIPAQGISGTLTIALARPNKLRSIGDMAGIGRIEQGYDGTTAWEVNPLTGPRLLGDAELEQLQQSETNVFNLQSLDALYATAQTLGRGTFGGVEAWEVKLVTKSGRESTAYFDPATKLMTGLKTTVASQLGNIPAEITLSEYKSFGGLMLPSRSRQVILGGMVEATSTIESVELDAPAERLPSFAPPPEIVALKQAP